MSRKTVRQAWISTKNGSPWIFYILLKRVPDFSGTHLLYNFYIPVRSTLQTADPRRKASATYPLPQAFPVCLPADAELP